MKRPKNKRIYEKGKPRLLFTDNWNSFWHIIFGVFAVKISCIVPLFIFYQLADQDDKNVFVDLLEFTYGYIAGLVFSIL
jgi:hypothetical protein